MITVFYDVLDDALRAEAEAVYLARRPFAVGYFRLWQVSRANLRRMTATEAALDLMSLGVILVSASSTILYSNATARSLLDEANGLRRRDERLGAATTSATMQLQATVSHVAHAAADQRAARRSAMFAVTRDGQTPLIVSVLAAAQMPGEPGDTAATVIIVDPATNSDTWLVPICKLFRLTNVEASLASLLVSGSTLADAALVLHLREATARSYLKLIFLKIGVNRQSELVRVLLSSMVKTNSPLQTDVIQGVTRPVSIMT